MTEFSPEEAEKRKRAVFDNMSPRRQKHILKKGYDKWDPFEEPKDPIDIRKDKTKRTTQTLVREFLQSRSSNGYLKSLSASSTKTIIFGECTNFPAGTATC